MLDLLICSRQFFRLAAVRSVEDLELIGNELQLAALVSWTSQNIIIAGGRFAIGLV